MFDQNLILENSVVRLRELTESDTEKLAAIAFEPSIWTYFIHKISHQGDLKSYIDEALLQRKLGLRYTFVIEDVNSKTIVGSTAFGNYSKNDQRIEIGWTWLGKDSQGSKINKNTKFLLLDFAFSHLKLERVEFKTDVLNQRARHALLKIGSTEEGVLRSHTLMPGNRRRDTIYYSILQNEWANVQSNVFFDCF